MTAEERAAIVADMPKIEATTYNDTYGFMPGYREPTEAEIVLFALRKHLAARLKELRDNLAGWAEGERCACAYLGEARPGCENCGGTGTASSTVGYLVPTEPDRAERRLVRQQLKAAISECEAIRGLAGEG